MQNHTHSVRSSRSVPRSPNAKYTNRNRSAHSAEPRDRERKDIRKNTLLNRRSVVKHTLRSTYRHTVQAPGSSSLLAASPPRILDNSTRQPAAPIPHPLSRSGPRSRSADPAAAPGGGLRAGLASGALHPLRLAPRPAASTAAGSVRCTNTPSARPPAAAGHALCLPLNLPASLPLISVCVPACISACHACLPACLPLLPVLV